MKDERLIFPPPKPEWLAEMEERDSSMERLLVFMGIFYAVLFSGILFVVSERDSTKAGCSVIIIICGGPPGQEIQEPEKTMTPFIITLIIVSLVEAGIIIRHTIVMRRHERRVRKMLDAIEARHMKGGRL